MSQRICAKVDSEVVSFSRSAGDDFQEISLLTETPDACGFRRHSAPWLEHGAIDFRGKAGLGTDDRPAPVTGHFECLCRRRTPTTSCFLSTAAVYGNTIVPATEETPCNPLGGYARAKLLAEEVIRTACSRHLDLRCGILRVSNVFGSTTNATRPQGVIPRICQAIHDEALMSIWGTERIRRTIFPHRLSRRGANRCHMRPDRNLQRRIRAIAVC